MSWGGSTQQRAFRGERRGEGGQGTAVVAETSRVLQELVQGGTRPGGSVVGAALTINLRSLSPSLANHVASIESLKPGVLEVIEGSAAESKKWFGASRSSSPRLA